MSKRLYLKLWRILRKPGLVNIRKKKYLEANDWSFQMPKTFISLYCEWDVYVENYIP